MSALVARAAAALATALLVLPTLCTSIKLPKFSWETVPVFMHTCNRSGAFDEATLRFITKFPMVTLEKGQAEDLGDSFAEDQILAAAKQIKSVDPDVHVLFYYNSVLDWNMYRLHNELIRHPSYWTWANSTTPTRTKGDASFPQPKGGMLSFDFGQQVVRDLWADTCLNMTATGFLDGCFSDRADGNPHGLNESYAPIYRAGHELVHQQLQARLVDAGKGVLISNNVLIEDVHGMMMESFGPNEKSILGLMNCSSQGKLCQAHSYRSCSPKSPGGASPKGFTNLLAAFLVAAGEYSYFGCSKGWYIDSWSHWNEEFDRPVGKPLADATKTGDMWSREFASGTKVTFNVTSNKGQIRWGKHSRAA